MQATEHPHITRNPRSNRRHATRCRLLPQALILFTRPPQARKASPVATKIPPASAGSLRSFMVSEMLGEVDERGSLAPLIGPTSSWLQPISDLAFGALECTSTLEFGIKTAFKLIRSTCV